MSLDEAQEQVSYWTTRAAVAEQSLNDVRTRRDERAAALTRLEEQQQRFCRSFGRDREQDCCNWNVTGNLARARKGT